MIKRIPEYGWSILVTALDDVRVEQVDHFLAWLGEVAGPVEAQAFDAHAVAGRRHLCFAALFALKAFAEASNVSESIAMEVLLQASGQRQVSRAIERLGVKPGRSDVAILLMSKDEEALQAASSRLTAESPGKTDEALLEVSPAKLKGLKELFEITDRQLAAERDADDPVSALTNLVVERMTLEAARRRAPSGVQDEKRASAQS